METVQTANPPTFESVWAGLQEVKQILKENAEERKEWQRENAEQLKEWKRENAERQKEWQRETAERQKENAERQKETAERQKETDRQMKEYNKRFGDFTNRFGEIVEYMVAPNLREKFRELGLNFPTAISNADVSDYDNNIFLEIDVKLENGDKAMLVEVKTKLTAKDVKEHIDRLEKMRKYANLHGDKRTFLGAVAGVVVKTNVKEKALEQGLYVVEPSGETFNITPPNGKPKEW